MRCTCLSGFLQAKQPRRKLCVLLALTLDGGRAVRDMEFETHELGSAIQLSRGCGRVICADFDGPISLDRLARHVDLDPSTDKYRECAPAEAQFIATRVISHGLVHDGLLVAQEEAENLARSFLNLFPEGPSKSFTNGEFLFIGSMSYLGRWWQVTPERYSSGVLVVGPTRSGVLWVADQGAREAAA